MSSGKVKLVILLATTFALLSTAASAAAEPLPIGQWDLNEGAGMVAHNDMWFLSGPGILSGDVTWSDGRFRRGLAFDGTNGAVEVRDRPVIDSPKVTVSAWVRSDRSPGLYRYIVAKGGNECCTGSYGLYTGAGGGIAFYVASSQTTYVVSPDGGTGIWDGQWHNVVGTFDGTTVRLYVDGRQVGTGTPDQASIQYDMPSGNDLVIGNYPWCDGLGFVGNIDEVKVFDRALGSDEIQDGYAISQSLPSYAPSYLLF
jgi:Concanavalin A-like lectin/glucanases superfamily